MKHSFSRFVPIVLLAPFSVAHGYEITTHGLITDHAYRVSVLNPTHPDSILPTIGFDRLDADYPFSFNGGPESTRYRDEAALINPSSTLPPVNSLYLRFPEKQERGVLDNLIAAHHLSGATGKGIEQQVRSWLLRGTVREDDNDLKIPGTSWWYRSGNHDPDPFGPLFRAPGHFYDPVYDRALADASACATYTCVRSTHWALGRTSPFTPDSDADDTNRRNHFTWQDARNNYWWSLILKRDSQGNGYDIADAIIDGVERMRRWATTVKNLGHVIHLVQDAGQPQHVRNDGHAPPTIAFFTGDGEADGAFEAFTDYRVRRNPAASEIVLGAGNPLRRMRDESLPTVNNLPFVRLGEGNPYPGGGATVQFSTPVKFFTTRHIEQGDDPTSLLTRRGLADLANRSFFTSGTLPGFRECVPPGASNCTPSTNPTYPLPPNNLNDGGYSEHQISSGLRIRRRVAFLSEFAYPIVDSIAPGYDAATGTLAAYGGKAPLVTKAIWNDVMPGSFSKIWQDQVGYTITYNNMRYMADVLLPRAVGYSAGMIDFFFRGRLEVTPIEQSIFAMMNAGDPHTVDSDGYPRRVDDPERIFGFEAVRLRVRNATRDIVESGTGTVVPQTTGGSGSRLVAIARYHRNACYQPDLGGERVRAFDGSITEPTCPPGRSVRTNFQEISVSAPITVAAGELDGEAVERLFDFSADPIPVNATDLFIQVAYRGPLGEEADGIAVGLYDVSEPTFVGIWNNSDHFWNGSAWLPSNASWPARNVYTFWACAGAPSRFVFRYQGSTGAVAMGLPTTIPGSVRLAFLFGQPANPNQRFAVRSVPIMQNPPQLPVRSGFTRGQIRQANREIVAADTLAAPYANCFLAPPLAPEHWCFDPVLRRRGIVFGEIAQPIFASAGGGGDGSDVDSVPLPPWASTVLRDGGENRFNQPGDLQACPNQPTASAAEIELIEWLEEEVWLGGSG